MVVYTKEISDQQNETQKEVYFFDAQLPVSIFKLNRKLFITVKYFKLNQKIVEKP